jgi:CRISPR-associated protein Cas5t
VNTLWLRLRAPFAAFRWLQAGVYRATSPVIPPSAAWGLALNLAHVDTRRADPKSPSTQIDPDAPPLCLAVGQPATADPPERATLYQQLHSYPVGNSGKDLAPRTHGAKYWIAPIRREILAGFDCVVGVRSPDSELLARIPAGLAGALPTPRYGLPFAGDNNLLLDRVDVLAEPPETRWYTRVTDHTDGASAGSCRLTIAIDRGDSSRTTSALFAPTEPTPTPPAEAWTWCPRPVEGEPTRV